MIDTSYAVYDKETKGYFNGFGEGKGDIRFTTLPSFYIDLEKAKRAAEDLTEATGDDWVAVKVTMEEYHA